MRAQRIALLLGSLLAAIGCDGSSPAELAGVYQAGQAEVLRALAEHVAAQPAAEALLQQARQSDADLSVRLELAPNGTYELVMRMPSWSPSEHGHWHRDGDAIELVPDGGAAGWRARWQDQGLVLGDGKHAPRFELHRTEG